VLLGITANSLPKLPGRSSAGRPDEVRLNPQDKRLRGSGAVSSAWP